MYFLDMENFDFPALPSVIQKLIANEIVYYITWLFFSVFKLFFRIMETFDFLTLPSVVQDLIVDEIVHYSVPENRIQFALICKEFNELLKHVKPKKIIENFRIDGSFY